MTQYCYVNTGTQDNKVVYKDELNNGSDIIAIDDADFTTQFKVISTVANG